MRKYHDSFLHWRKVPKQTWGLLLMGTALAGVAVSYHLTLEARFTALEQGQRQLLEAQANQDQSYATKLDLITKLDQQVNALQNFVVPLSKLSRNQNMTLVELQDSIEQLKHTQQELRVDLEKLASSEKKSKTSTPTVPKVTEVLSPPKVLKFASTANVMTLAMPQSPGEMAEKAEPLPEADSMASTFSMSKSHVITVPPLAANN